MIMKNVLVLIGLFLTTMVYAQPESDTTLYRYTEARRVSDKLSIKRLSLADIVTARRSLPNNVQHFKNLEFLSLRPIAVSFGKPRGGAPCIIRYAGSKIRSMPDWISQLRHLQELDLIGINEVDFEIVLTQLTSLNKLTKLSIDPDHFDISFVDNLVRLKSLRSLKIRASVTDDELAMIKNGLPDCEIVTGIYADY
jgi:hypothetical protein